MLFVCSHLIHPDVPNMVFAGHNQSFEGLPGSNLGAKWWIEHVLTKSRQLPTRDAMLAEADTHYRWQVCVWLLFVALSDGCCDREST